MNAALHCADHVMYSPLHAKVSAVLGNAQDALDVYGSKSLRPLIGPLSEPGVGRGCRAQKAARYLTGSPMLLARERVVKVYGTPAPKGSLHCIGSRGRRNHVLIEDNKATKPWREFIKAAGLAICGDEPYEGALGVEATLTLARPASVMPAERPYPHKKSPGHGDSDKLGRTVLDGLQDAHLFSDDAQIVELVTRKGYPDSPGMPDLLERPGALIRVYPIGGLT